MQQQIRFCTAPDGVRIAYAITGDGPPLVKAANYLTHLEHEWHSPVWRHWLQGLSETHRLIRYDARGSGLSDWDVASFNMEAWVRDLEAVVSTLNFDRFPLLGISQGAAVCVAYAVKHPERVSRLVLYGGYARGRFHRDLEPRSSGG
jgi:pimeloyl-ACP methyl ester carboxylesterase